MYFGISFQYFGIILTSFTSIAASARLIDLGVDGGGAVPESAHHHPLVGRHAGHLHQLLLHPLHYLTLLTALSLVKTVLARLNCSQLS